MKISIQTSFIGTEDIMDKRKEQLLAFAHFAVTEMRPLWLLWYTVFNTFQSIVTSAAISIAYFNKEVVACIFYEKLASRNVAKCAKTAYRNYLESGPQEDFKDCSEQCPGSGIGVLALSLGKCFSS